VGDCGDYALTGQPFLTTYCRSCHGAGQQLGAVRLDSLEDLHQHQERVAVRLGEGTMPPSGGPRPDELLAFQAWLDCGAPGQDSGRPEGSEVTNPSASWEEQIAVTELAPGRLLFTMTETGGQDRGEQIWELTEGGLALSESTRYFDGSPVTDVWEPPLLVWHPSEDSWSRSVSHTRLDDLGSVSWSEEWTVVRSESLDGRLLFRDELRGFEASAAEGGRVSVMFSADTWLTTAIGDPELGLLEAQALFFDNLSATELIDESVLIQQRVVRWD
jgi:hypothetical protein